MRPHIMLGKRANLLEEEAWPGIFLTSTQLQRKKYFVVTGRSH